MEAIRWAGIPVHTIGTHSLMQFLPGEKTQDAYNAALAMVSGKIEHPILTFIGEPGRGKTHLGIGIGLQWIGQNKGTVRYYRTVDLLEAIRREYDRPPVNDQGTLLKSVMEWCQEVSLLILDDLGVEKQTEWVMEKLESLIDYRYINGLYTVITTNMRPEQLSRRIASRIKEGIVVTLGGEDYRGIINKQRKGIKECQ